ncbi:MAG: hypothetical protein GWM98_14230, partial [Nitrospinaceae bacterium]|nr:hypothetical protein [Nitrospinaceae bacterium]
DPANDTIYGIEQESNAVVLLRDDLVRKKISFEKWQPTGLALDPDGALWVSDGENDRIVKLDEDGAVVQEVGTPGSGLGRLDGPSDIVINRD